MQLKSGTLLLGGNYRIIETLGRGGFGVTYLAEQVNLHRQVCIKEFFPKGYYKRDSDTKTLTLSSDSFGDTMNKFKAKFIKEAQTIVALDHYNIVHIFDVFEENNTVYYVMEYINGDTLSNVVKINGTLTEEEAVNYIRQIASALEYIHERHIMHLDVKPGNVMLRKGNDHAILIDFGLSKHYDEQSGEATTSTPIGVSHGYAPAEQYQMGGIRRFSPETDIYSLGATLYYLVIGSIPPSASELESMDIPDLPETLSEGVRRAIRGAMKYLRKDRPQSIKEFLALLDNDQAIIAVVPNDNKTHITSDMGIEQEDTKYNESVNQNSIDSEKERKPDSNALGQQINYDKGSKHENKRAVTPAVKPTTSGHTQSKPTQKQKKRRGGCIVWLLLIFIIAFLAFFISKQYAEAPSTNVPGNSTENQMSPMATTLILDTHNINAGNQGESGSIAYTIENSIDGCELSIEYADNIGWIKTNLGEGVINYEVEANPNNEPRKCDLVVIYGEITQIINVTQTALSEEERPKPQFILTSESDVILSPYGETKYITYTLSNPIEGKRIVLDKGGATWFDATETNGKIAITAKANNSGRTLSSTLNVKYDNESFSVVVKQNAKPKFTLTSESNITLNPYGETKYITYTLSNPIEGKRIVLDKGSATWFDATETSGKIAITAKANNSGKTLSATLKVSYGDESFSVVVKQNAKPKFTLTSESNITLNPYGETKYITYTLSNPIEGKRIVLDKGGATWFDATETNGKIAITAKANNSGRTLSSTLNVKYDNESFSVVVKQNAKPKFTLTSESNITLNPYGETKYITYTLSNPIEGKRIVLDKGSATWFDATETSGKIAITAKANNSGKTLSATLKVSYGDESFSVNVKQNAISRPSSGTTAGHGWVDLGLSVKWATCNVGSKSPKELGDSYAWGDTRWRISFEEHNKSYSRGDYDISGSVNNDVARKEWGGSWRMPTIEEWEELISKCEWTPVSGGYNVTGPNGGRIFLPFTGESKVNSTYVERNISCGEYWSSTPCPGSEKAYSIDIGSRNRKATDRYKGCTVRPVTN